jgi:hypothetical protein
LVAKLGFGGIFDSVCSLLFVLPRRGRYEAVSSRLRDQRRRHVPPVKPARGAEQTRRLQRVSRQEGRRRQTLDGCPSQPSDTSPLRLLQTLRVLDDRPVAVALALGDSAQHDQGPGATSCGAALPVESKGPGGRVGGRVEMIETQLSGGDDIEGAGQHLRVADHSGCLCGLVVEQSGLPTIAGQSGQVGEPGEDRHLLAAQGELQPESVGSLEVSGRRRVVLAGLPQVSEVDQ